jgi:3-oxoadipate CoA-transferase beta subunit
MDLAIGAKKTLVMMELCTKAGESKIVPRCSYPLTGLACVSRVYTDMAVLDMTPAGVRVLDLCDGLSAAALQAMTAVRL